MANGFRVTADKTYRGNGRWAKVCRLHKSSIIEKCSSLVEVWTPYWHLAVGREGELRAFLGDDFPKARMAHAAAKDYIAGLV